MNEIKAKSIKYQVTVANNSFRDAIEISVSDLDEDLTEEGELDTCIIEFQLSDKGKNRLYFIAYLEEGRIIFTRDYTDEKEQKLLVDKIYSQMNKSLPFDEKNERYPETPKEILNLPKIKELGAYKGKMKGDEYCYVICLDSDGKVLYTLSIYPH